ncbi:coactosin, putative [Entamoeba invadens IP1]|uniref:coactosin, putative n=1 Tax=Entamoeba invadens IP1 TaxID=370355 RepID=UPI0002C3DCB8|nr:coactosin, putative [Entamoeba invadens IP1]ELP90397.1 coactosin, putative [Entamoeba invadens IP1]|eukprot:XP_004257168.1 coactosin, putative [Entamoeba invadens IP1]
MAFDLSDPELVNAVNEVIDDKNTDVEYCVFGVTTNPNKVVLDVKGKGGLNEVKAALKDDQIQFAYYRTISGDAESHRVKFVLISWASESITKPKLRASMSMLKGEMKNEIFKNFHIELHATSLDDLKEEEIAAKLKKVGGADYSTNSGSS